ncbi:general substrate transporter [Dipodascopsis tothii]|uniref:general substrate transporter n=1 Tax=Dipodascopsis tothii TaxID=44089 RepID=UPI0034CF7814
MFRQLYANHRHDLTVIGVCVFISLASLIYGMDGGYLSGVLEMPAFKRTYGEQLPDGSYYLPSGKMSLMTSLPYAGHLAAALGSGYLGDRLGRRAGLALTCVCSIVGVFIQIFTTSQAVFILGRFFNYISIGLSNVLAPVYQTEVAPRSIRAAMVTTYQFNIVSGSFLVSIINNFTSKIAGNASFRIPIGLLLVPPCIILPGLLFVPESPRWLVRKGRRAAARKAVAFLYGRDPAFDPDAHIDQLTVAVHEQDVVAHKVSYADCFRGTNRRRTLLACMIHFWQPLSGLGFVFNYGTIFFQEVHVSNPFVTTIITSVVNIVGTVVSFFLVDRVDRRRLLLIGSVVMFIGHFFVGVCGVAAERISAAAGNDHAAMICIIVFIETYVFGLSIAWGPLTWVVASEISASDVREKTQSLAVGTNILISWIVTFTLPYLLNADKAGLGPKVGFIYAGFILGGAVCVYLFLPELRARPLEEIDEMFEKKLPSRKFKREFMCEQADPRLYGRGSLGNCRRPDGRGH